MSEFVYRDCVKNFKEHPDEIGAEVKGKFPPWLKGHFMRIGPGLFDISDNFTVNHYFDGMAIVFRYYIADGKVTFRSRFIQSDAYKKALQAKRPVYTEFATPGSSDSSKNFIQRALMKLINTEMTDNCSLSVYQIQDEVYAATESCFIRKLDPHSLETKDKVDLSKMANSHFHCTHPFRSSDGSVYNMSTSFLSSSFKYQLVKFPPPNGKNDSAGVKDVFKNATVVASIKSRWSTAFSYFHSFGASENYFVFVEMPLVINAYKLYLSQVKGKSLKDCMEWHPNDGCRFVVVERATGLVHKTKVMSAGFFVFHHINAYEEADHLVVDLFACDSDEYMEKFTIAKLRKDEFGCEHPPQARRFVIPLLKAMDSVAPGVTKPELSGIQSASYELRKDGTVFLTPENLTEFGMELPAVNPGYVGKPYQYIFATGAFEQGTYARSVTKVNLKTREVKKWNLGGRPSYCGEPIFVPKPNATAEDDGVLLVTVIDQTPNTKDFMVVLDAGSMKEVARATVDVEVPVVMHGHFVPA